MILAFYNFVRTADDIADHAELPSVPGLVGVLAVLRRLGGLGVKIVSPLVGRYATSMEMAGMSVTFCKLDEECQNLLKAAMSELGLSARASLRAERNSEFPPVVNRRRIPVRPNSPIESPFLRISWGANSFPSEHSVPSCWRRRSPCVRHFLAAALLQKGEGRVSLQ